MDWKKFLLVTHLCLFCLASFANAEPPASGTVQAQQNYSFLGMVEESLFGDPTDPWRPLSLSTLFSEGWNEPFDYPTNGSGGAPRQGWINSYDGVFYRLWFLSYSNTQDFNDNGNQDIGSYTLFAPVSRRFQIRFDVPFFVSNRGGQNNDYNNNFGDFVISPRFLLSESQDFSYILAVPVRHTHGRKGQWQ